LYSAICNQFHHFSTSLAIKLCDEALCVGVFTPQGWSYYVNKDISSLPVDKTNCILLY